jgi:hypothetical protein
MEYVTSVGWEKIRLYQTAAQLILARCICTLKQAVRSVISPSRSTVGGDLKHSEASSSPLVHGPLLHQLVTNKETNTITAYIHSFIVSLGYSQVSSPPNAI